MPTETILVNMDNLAVEAVGLSKHFGPVQALDGLDLSVQTGEVHGFLGPNGSGKSARRSTCSAACAGAATRSAAPN